MAAYRPLLVLAGIWVVLLMIGVAAYDHLMYTVQDTPEITSTDAEVYPHQRENGDRPAPLAGPDGNRQDETASGATAKPTPQPGSDAGDTPAAVEAPAPTSVSAGSVGALVLTCALGCWLLSRQLQAPRRTSRKRRKRGPNAPLPHSPQLVSPPATRAVRKPVTAPQRLAAYDPAQPSIHAASPGPQVAAVPKQAAAETEVTVVPADAEHPLDWPEESLVNSVDVRRQRSLSSFL